MTTIDGKSPNLAHETTATIHDLLMEPAIRERLAQICPDAFCDGDLQMDLLLEAMGKYHTTEDIKELVVDENERYEFRWSGKQKAKYESQKSSTGTLRPCPEESKNWDTTQNLYIEGDNLEVLKILKRAYAGKIKMIYIDPPYNTGKDFVYKDDYTDNLKNYLKQTGQLTADGKAKSSNTAADGRFHTNWLNMMYPRLRLARELLSDDGVIFISIDDNEVENLMKMCNEVFGESNIIANFDWRKKTGANDAKDIAIVTEHILLYAKSHETTLTNQIWQRDIESINVDRYKYEDEFVNTRGKFYYDTLDRGGLQYSDSMNYGIKAPDGGLIFPNGRDRFINDGWIWKWSEDKVKWGIENKFLEFTKSNKSMGSSYTIKYKVYQNVDNEGNLREKYGRAYMNLITDPINQIGNFEIKKLFNNTLPFPNPKPTGLIIYLFNTIKNKSAIFLDFFSGSATTAHAVIQLNAEDGGNRRFIMVQLPEATDQKSEAAKAGYKNICEIGKERIRRAGEKIIEDAKKAGKDVSGLDVGFKVFKLSESNMNKWHLELADLKDKNDMEKAAIAALRDGKNTIRRKEIESENTKRKVAGLAPFDIELCVIYEWLLKYGVMPDCRITTAQIGGHKVYSVSGGAFMICLEHGLNRDWAKALVTYRDECLSGMDEATKSDAWHVMVADECFADTRDMQNVAKTLHDNGLKDEHWIVV